MKTAVSIYVIFRNRKRYTFSQANNQKSYYAWVDFNRTSNIKVSFAVSRYSPTF